jgi:hypothetical protein
VGHDQVQFGEVQVQLSWASCTVWCPESAVTASWWYAKLDRYNDVSALKPGIIMLLSSLEHRYLRLSDRNTARAW